MDKKQTKKIYFITLFSLLFSGLFFTVKNADASCIYKDNTFQISEDPSSPTSPIYRLYNNQTGAYLYTRSTDDANYVLGKWPDFEFTDAIPAFCASLTIVPNLTPIYRLYNTKNGAYLYTRGDADRDHVLNTWPEFEFTDGVPAFYASLIAQDGLTPIYRLYNTLNGMYLYTRGDADKDHVMSTWPEFEFTDGVPAFYASIATDAGPTLYKYAGPEISVGLWNYTKDDLNATPFKVEANKKYNIKNSAGDVIASVENNIITRVSYTSNQNFNVYNSIPDTLVNKEVIFESADGNNSDLIFDVYRPASTYDRYRGKIKIRYTDSNNIWVINTLPLEQYVWGDGETTGTGNINHTRVMASIFRTYGYWYIKYATANAPYGFKIKSDSGNQIYTGYDWEIAHPNIKKAAEETRGMLATYGNDVALTPYSSWSDGRTRSFQERWGSTEYPWCQSVADPYGKNTTLTTAELESAGNHMVGLVANGSVNLAANYGWDWQRIMKYYYTGISLAASY